MISLAERIQSIPPLDQASMDAVSTRAANVLRPSGALDRLDQIAVTVAGVQHREQPAVRAASCLVFGADHGVAIAGVSAYPVEVTLAMRAAIEQQKATICAMGAVAGIPVKLIDVGVGNPTADIRTERAVSPQRWDATVSAAFDAVNDLDADLLVLGELGIGNTTAAAAVCAAIAGDDAERWVGRGTGVDDDGMQRKRDAVRAACRRIGTGVAPLDVLAEVGGAELVGMAAAIVAAAHRRLPVVLDGFVTCAAAFAVHQTLPSALAHCIAGHCSAEAAHDRLLGRLGLDPLLRLDMRLGEASGAMAAAPLVAMACAAVVNVPTFGEWFG